MQCLALSTCPHQVSGGWHLAGSKCSRSFTFWCLGRPFASSRGFRAPSTVQWWVNWAATNHALVTQKTWNMTPWHHDTWSGGVCASPVSFFLVSSFWLPFQAIFLAIYHQLLPPLPTSTSCASQSHNCLGCNWKGASGCIYYISYMGVVQNTFSRTALNRSANRVATAVPQWAIAEGFVLRWSDHIHKI